MLGHAIFVGRQYSLEEGIRLVSDCDLVVEVEGFVRTSILQWRYVSKACVKGRIGLSSSRLGVGQVSRYHVVRNFLIGSFG